MITSEIHSFDFYLKRSLNKNELMEEYPNYRAYLPVVTEEIVRDVIVKLNMKVKSQVIVDFVMGRYSLVEKQ